MIVSFPLPSGKENGPDRPAPAGADPVRCAGDRRSREAAVRAGRDHRVVAVPAGAVIYALRMIH
ncbi:hypothetical protein GCM10010517_17850 [Streptosporangium fragile]|uniref:Uncharacterized protein n=1 Tax=Streptosporangium fragile TaxID=46186 RepID=A0ABN3VVD7_9ACTN